MAFTKGVVYIQKLLYFTLILVLLLSPAVPGESVYDDVYDGNSIPESVYGNVYNTGTNMTVSGSVYAQDPPYFSFQEKGSIDVLLAAAVPAVLVLDSVCDVPDTVSLAVYADGLEVGRVSGCVISRTVPFTVDGQKLINIQLAGKGRLNESKLIFSETQI